MTCRHLPDPHECRDAQRVRLHGPPTPYRDAWHAENPMDLTMPLPTPADVLRRIANAIEFPEDGQPMLDAVWCAIEDYSGRHGASEDVAAWLRDVCAGRHDLMREHFALVDAVNDATTREARVEASRALRDWRDKYGGNPCAADEHTCDRYGIDLGGEDVDGIAICAGVRGDWTPDGYPTYGKIVTRSEVAGA